MSFFFFILPFSSKISYTYFLNGIRAKKQKKSKLHHICYCHVENMQTKSTTYTQYKQNSRAFAKKVLVIKLNPKKFEEIDELDSYWFQPVTTSGQPKVAYGPTSSGPNPKRWIRNQPKARSYLKVKLGPKKKKLKVGLNYVLTNCDVTIIMIGSK